MRSPKVLRTLNDSGVRIEPGAPSLGPRRCLLERRYYRKRVIVSLRSMLEGIDGWSPCAAP